MRIAVIALVCLCCSGILNRTAAQGINRKAFALTVMVDSTAAYVDSIKPGPFIQGPNILQIYPGEKVYLEVEEIKDAIVRLVAVAANKNPLRTLEISLVQNAKGRVHESMMLKVVNPFKKDLIYRASAFFYEPKKWASTSVLPVSAGLASYESWSDIIITIALYDWKLMDPTNR